MTGFYDDYGTFKDYATPVLKDKHVRRLDREIWAPLAATPDMAVLEVGCGTGLVLAYLKHKGITDLLGLDQDPALAAVVPEAVRGDFRAVDIRTFLADGADGRTFDRVLLIDVLEHFPPEQGRDLLRALAAVLRPGGRILVRVPNMGSPWGGQYQFGDLTHRTGYAPSSLRQLAIAAGLRVTALYPHAQGSPGRRLFDRLLQGLLGRLLMTPPEIWTANVFAVMAPAGRQR